MKAMTKMVDLLEDFMAVVSPTDDPQEVKAAETTDLLAKGCGYERSILLVNGHMEFYIENSKKLHYQILDVADDANSEFAWHVLKYIDKRKGEKIYRKPRFKNYANAVQKILRMLERKVMFSIGKKVFNCDSAEAAEFMLSCASQGITAEQKSRRKMEK